ncbi:MAG TPA: hypothetical protein VL426_01575 [Candidatus Binatia bacterium]|nr:hypothetical protein [Candidatus Binatia bacterium]
MEDDKKPEKKPLEAAARAVTVRRVLIGLGCVIALLLSFHAGKAAGYRKARFSYGWGENYHRNFAGPRRGFMHGGFEDRDFTDAHGTAGKVLSVDGSTLVIKGRDDVEKTVILSQDTSIRRFRDRLSAADLRTDDVIVVIGEPDDQGRIAAKFVRVLPPMPHEGTFEQRVR